MTMKNISLLLALLATNSLYADSLDADLNNDTIKVKYKLSSENADLGISAAALLTEDNGEVYSVGIRTQGRLNASENANIRGGFGLRGYHADPEIDDSFQSLALGGYIDVEIAQIPGFIVGAEVYFAPSITTTDGLENFQEISFRVSYQVFENAKVYAGIRDIEVDINGNDFNFDDGGHVGFSLEF